VPGDVWRTIRLTCATAVGHGCIVVRVTLARRPAFAWLRFLHQPLAAVGLLAVDPSAWPLYLTVLIVVT
jgi:hypothetical protein